jgi:hypothetical protein
MRPLVPSTEMTDKVDGRQSESEHSQNKGHLHKTKTALSTNEIPQAAAYIDLVVLIITSMFRVARCGPCLVHEENPRNLTWHCWTSIATARTLPNLLRTFTTLGIGNDDSWQFKGLLARTGP